jgi:O-antigen/teichoic acid export membrane protein
MTAVSGQAASPPKPQPPAAPARRFWRNVGLTLLANLVIGATGVATGLLAAHLLGPQGRGELAAIQSWPFLIAQLAMVGMPEAIVYFSSRSPERAGSYLGSGVLVIGISGAVFGATGWWLMPRLLHSHSPAVIGAARFSLSLIVVYALFGTPHQVLRSLGVWRTWNLFRLLPGCTWLTTLVGVALFARGTSAAALSQLLLLGQALLAVPILWVVRRHVSGPCRPRPNDARALLRYGLPTVLSALPNTLNLRLDQLIMATFLDARTLGYYVVAVTWSSLASPVISAIGPVLFPFLGAMPESREQHRTLARILPRLASVIALLTLALFVATPVAIPLLYGADFRPASAPALVLVLGSAFSGFNLTLQAGLQGLGRPWDVLTAELSGLAVTVPALTLLLPAYGIMGAAVASLAAYSVTTMFLLLKARKQLIINIK